MHSLWRIPLLTVLAMAAFGLTVHAQSTPPAPVVLRIQITNFVNYFNDVTDWTKLAKDPTQTALAGSKPNFATSLDVADIISVNDVPVKGVFTERRIQYKRAVTQTPGHFIADSASSAIQDRFFEILKLDGTPIGNFIVSGMGGVMPAPGAPSIVKDGNYAIVGGTGAFLGARGQAGGLDEPSSTSARNASASEDPSKRRAYPNGHRIMVLQVIPLSVPAIAQISGGPAVVHGSDFSPVTAAKPAKAGEILTLLATGLGPAQPACLSAGGSGGTSTACAGVTSLEPGEPFPTSPLALVNSPVDVTLNGQPAEVQYAGGYPGTTNTYQVNFRVPVGTPSGPATLRIAAAWIPGAPVTIQIQ